MAKIQKSVLQNQQGETNPESWMQKLLSSEDAQLDNAQREGLFGGLFQFLMMLLMLSMKLDKDKSNEEKLQAVSDAVFNKKVDISSFTPTLKVPQSVSMPMGNLYSPSMTENRKYPTS